MEKAIFFIHIFTLCSSIHGLSSIARLTGMKTSSHSHHFKTVTHVSQDQWQRQRPNETLYNEDKLRRRDYYT